MEPDRELRNGPSTLWSTDLGESRKDCPMEKRQSLQKVVFKKLDRDMQMNETGPFPYTMHKKIDSNRRRTQM